MNDNTELERRIRFTSNVQIEVARERIRQDDKWGEQNHPALIYLAILGEEVGEATKDLLEAHFSPDKSERADLYRAARTELIQVAAVAVAMVESLDRNELLPLDQLDAMLAARGGSDE